VVPEEIKRQRGKEGERSGGEEGGKRINKKKPQREEEKLS